MSENPYEPPSEPQPEILIRFPPQQGHCPGCQGAVSQRKLWRPPSVRCDRCSTEIALGFQDNKRIGRRCIISISLAASLVGVACFAIHAQDYFSAAYYLLLIVPLAGLYTAAHRWMIGLPYPLALRVNGRIVSVPFSETHRHLE